MRKFRRAVKHSTSSRNCETYILTAYIRVIIIVVPCDSFLQKCVGVAQHEDKCRALARTTLTIAFPYIYIYYLPSQERLSAWSVFYVVL